MIKRYQIFIIILLCALISSCSSQNDKSISQETIENKNQELKQKINDARTQLISKYSPIVFPPSAFEKIKVFTYNLQDLLISDSSKYILFEGILNDIRKDENTIIIHFTSALSNDFIDDRTVEFYLKSKYEDIKPLIDNPPENDYFLHMLPAWGRDKDYFVICQVTDVKKIINHSVQGYSSEGTDDVELQIHSPDTFSVTGELIEMIKYPSESK